MIYSFFSHAMPSFRISVPRSGTEWLKNGCQLTRLLLLSSFISIMDSNICYSADEKGCLNGLFKWTWIPALGVSVELYHDYDDDDLLINKHEYTFDYGTLYF